MRALAGIAAAAFVLLAPALARAAPHTTVEIDPTSWLNNTYSGGVAHAVSEHVALRLDATLHLWSSSNPDLATASGNVNLTAPIFLDHAFQGPFIEPGLTYRSDYFSGYVMEVPAAGPIGYSALRQDEVRVLALVGWQWTFHDQFHLAAAIGASKSFDGTQGASETYVRAGYAW